MTARIPSPSDQGLRRSPATVGSAQLVRERLGPAHRADARTLPGPEDQPQGERGGHEVEAQAAEDLVHSAEGLEDPGQRRPQRAAHHARRAWPGR